MAKQNDQDVTADLVRVMDENAALKAQQDQVLDLMADMRAEMDALKANQGAIVDAVQPTDLQSELDAELDALTAEFADYPAIEVFQRRATFGAEASQDIRLSDEPDIMADPTGTSRKWKLRWFNFAKEGRASYAQSEGYLKVEWKELRDAESLSTADRTDVYVRQGDKGQQVLCKIPLKLFTYKRRRDAARRDGLMQSAKGLRDHVANRVAGMAGSVGDNADQAGSTVASKFNLTIKAGEPERVTL